jgi:DNA-binding NarL/FixJ family response regulator
MAEEEKGHVIRVFLVVENRLLREALTRILNKKNDIAVVAATAASSDILSQILHDSPEVLLLDSPGVGSSNAPLLADLRRQIPALKIVMVGMDEEKEAFLSTVRSGVAGYLLKEASALEVVAAVRSVVNEEAVCPPRLCYMLFGALASHTAPPPVASLRMEFGLTRREQQLIQMISGGLTNKEIANQWSLSEQTVKNHVHRVLQKLGASDRLSAVEVCRLRGWSA